MNHSSSPSRRELLAQAAGAASLPLLGPLVAGCGGGGGATVGGGAASASALWTQTLLDCITDARPGPPICARMIGITATAAYDAWACYDAKAVGTRLGGQLRRPAAERTEANKRKAVSFAAYRALVDLFPGQKAIIDARMRGLGYNGADASMDAATPAGVGNRVAKALLEFRHQDGSNQLNGYADTTGYVPVNTPDNVVDPSRWQQLRFANGKAPGFIAPHWGLVVPFALSSPAALRPPAPATFGSPTYLDRCQEVIDVTARLDDRMKVIAEYWADGPGSVLPPGHWQLFGLYVSERDRHTLDQDVQMFFLLGNAVMDAGIACWECKRFYDTSRPITAIRHLFAGKPVKSFGGPTQGIVTVDGSQWSPYQSPNFVTPPFAEYMSGHSTFSRAAAEVLRLFKGSDQFGMSVSVPPGSSGFEDGVPARAVNLHWPTFTDAADEAGLSRRYGGIHFEWGDVEGRRCGRSVGQQVYEKAMRYIRGAEPAQPAAR
jgi:hypothetical protein